MSILDKYTNILVDATALAILHTREYKEFIPVIIARFNVYTTKFAIIEFLSLLSYYKIEFSKDIINYLYKIYRVIDIDDKVMYRSSLIISDLMRHSIWCEIVDVVHATLSLEKKLIIITADSTRYDPFRKYGVVTIHVNELLNTIKRMFQRQ